MHIPNKVKTARHFYSFDDFLRQVHLKGHFRWMRQQQQQPVPASHHFRFTLIVCLSSLLFSWRYLCDACSFMIYNPHVWVLWLKPKPPSLACCSKAPSAVWLSASVIFTNTQAFEAHITALEHHLRVKSWGNGLKS